MNVIFSLSVPLLFVRLFVWCAIGANCVNETLSRLGQAWALGLCKLVGVRLQLKLGSVTSVLTKTAPNTSNFMSVLVVGRGKVGFNHFAHGIDSVLLSCAYYSHFIYFLVLAPNILACISPCI